MVLLKYSGYFPKSIKLSPLQYYFHGLPWWFRCKESTCECRRPRFNPWVGKIPWRREWQPTSAFLPGKSLPWTEEPGGLQTIGLQRVGHD